MSDDANAELAQIVRRIYADVGYPVGGSIREWCDRNPAPEREVACSMTDEDREELEELAEIVREFTENGTRSMEEDDSFRGKMYKWAASNPAPEPEVEVARVHLSMVGMCVEAMSHNMTAQVMLQLLGCSKGSVAGWVPFVPESVLTDMREERDELAAKVGKFEKFVAELRGRRSGYPDNGFAWCVGVELRELKRVLDAS